MARYQAVLAYDGTGFKGFQRQAQARTVQGEVETALRTLGWLGRSILASGRTDTGVHAVGQVIAFDLDWPHSCAELGAALNDGIPADIAVRSVQTAPEGFHPRYDARARLYRYRVLQDAIRHPLSERFAWRIWPAVDLDRLHQTAAHMVGEWDFQAFGSPPRPGSSTVRRVVQSTWRVQGAMLEYDLAANAFLYRMVRRIVYALVKVGQGRLEIEDVVARLENPESDPLQGLAPPQGLTLVKVTYDQAETAGDGQ